MGYDAAKALAEAVIDSAYGYKYGPVLFKPTLAGGKQTFRPTKKGALSYFVGGDSAYPKDTGFGIKGWRKVQFVNSAIWKQDFRLFQRSRWPSDDHRAPLIVAFQLVI